MCWKYTVCLKWHRLHTCMCSHGWNRRKKHSLWTLALSACAYKNKSSINIKMKEMGERCLCVRYSHPHFWTELHQISCVRALMNQGGHGWVADAFWPQGQSFKMANPESAYIICVKILRVLSSISPRMFEQSQPNSNRVLHTSGPYGISLGEAAGPTGGIWQ